MTDEERQMLCANLRSGSLKWLMKAADEIERLATLAQSDAEPSQDMRDRLAIYLMALDECSGGDDPKKYVKFFTKYLSEQRGSEHSGDCKKQPWTCSRCVCDEHLTKADHFIAAFPALAQSDMEPVRAFAKAVLHGDDEHKAWLNDAAEAFVAGKPLPAPRGKGTKQSDAELVAWQLVPKNPTQEMLDAADHAPDDDDWQTAMAKAYKAMLAVAPAQSDAEPGILHNKEAGFREIVTRDTAVIYDNNPRLRLVEEMLDFDRKLIGFRVYDAPPRPDASAGLIEAAEKARTLLNGRHAVGSDAYMAWCILNKVCARYWRKDFSKPHADRSEK